MNSTEIKQKYLALHNALGSQKDAEDKELFDQQHRQVWADCDTELKARKAELEAMASLTPEQERELAELEAMFPTPVEVTPPRDLAAEINEIKANITAIKTKVGTK